jgi:hypothetical protein
MFKDRLRDIEEISENAIMTSFSLRPGARMNPSPGFSRAGGGASDPPELGGLCRPSGLISGRSDSKARTISVDMLPIRSGTSARHLVRLARNRRVDVAWVPGVHARSVGPNAFLR